MRFKNNPFMTLNYGMLGVEKEIDYVVEIGPYDVGGYETDHNWYDKCKRPAMWTKDLSIGEAKHMFNIILMALKNPNYNKGTRLLKKVHSKTFIDDEINYIVYSYKIYDYIEGPKTKRTYIQFNPVKDIKDRQFKVVLALPKLGKNIPKEIIT